MSSRGKSGSPGRMIPLEIQAWLDLHECQIVTERYLREQIAIYDAAKAVVESDDYYLGEYCRDFPELVALREAVRDAK